MDFSNRNSQARGPAPVSPQAAVATPGNGGRKSKVDKGKWGRVAVVLAIAAVVILLIGVTLLISLSTKTEDSYVDTGKLQAVFLNTGQVYFGNVTALNDKYFVLTNIYYLQTSNPSGSNSSTNNTNSNVTLVKLGCELHRPYDKMVINRTSVTFWENLQSSGQVAQAVSKFQQQNPHGQQCSDQSSSSGSTTNATQPASSNSGSGSSSNSNSTGSNSSNP